MWNLYVSKIVSYAQGFMLLRQAATEFGWNLNYGVIALMWRGGCIVIRQVPSLSLSFSTYLLYSAAKTLD